MNTVMTGSSDHTSHPSAPSPWSGLRRRGELRPWSEDECDRLRQLHAGQVTSAEIAARLGRTAEAVSNMSRRLGLRRRDSAQPWTSGQLWLLHRMIEDGSSLHEIAEATGHPRSSVADKLRRLNVKSQRFRRPWTEEECQSVLTLHAGGASLAAIAQVLPRRSPDAIQQKLQELVGPAPFRSTRRHTVTDGLVVAQVTTGGSVAATGVASTGASSLSLSPSSSFSSSSSASSPSPARSAVRLRRERHAAKPVLVPASTDEMVRWLRSRDFMVLHQTPGWRVDHHRLEDEGSLLEFVNLRRLRLNLPPFTRAGACYAG